MKNRKYLKTLVLGFLLVLFIASIAEAQEPYRRGTTAANFLEIGYGSAGVAMGDAYVAAVNDLSAIYWNPAGLAHMRQGEAMFVHQPWVADINTSMVAASVYSPLMGTFAFSVYSMDYGREEVTTLVEQDGTGEHYSAGEFCFGLSYGRSLAKWFSFGASAKFITSQIWHTSAKAVAVDLGAIVQTGFFSTKNNEGMLIGMSISNYGTRMKYDGIDLLQPIDPNPNTWGEFNAVEGQYKTQGWELPLIFRIGVAYSPLVTENHRFTVEADALHPNNNPESVNVGGQYALTVHSAGTFYVRGGYKALFMENSEYGLSYGGGFIYRLSGAGSMALKLDIAKREVGLLGDSPTYSISLLY